MAIKQVWKLHTSFHILTTAPSNIAADLLAQGITAMHILRPQVDYAKNTVPVKINDESIDFSDAAEHVGMVRSVSGNLPTILARFTAHKKALGAVLHTGMARSHRGNPAASLHVHKLYACPVLFSGIAPLVLSDQETNLVSQHIRKLFIVYSGCFLLHRNLLLTFLLAVFLGLPSSTYDSSRSLA